MMKKQIDLQLLATLGGGILFNFLFWRERLALNLLLYSIFILLMVFINKETVKQKKMDVFGLSHLLAAVLVVYNHSYLTLITWYLSLAIFIGFAYLTSLRSIFTAIYATIVQILYAPVNTAVRIGKIKIGGYSGKPLMRSMKYVVVPILLVVVFATFYSNANSTFDKYLGLLFSHIGDFFVDCLNFIFGDLSFVRFLHLLLGILATAALLLKYPNQSILNWEAAISEKLFRIRRKKEPTNPSQNYSFNQPAPPKRNILGLKVENLIGIISFSALNILILMLNVIDISTVWFASPVKSSHINYSTELHDGTNALIGSILAAMAVILFFFRGNLNFYRKNRVIVMLSYIWIIQNTLLVGAVFLRDFNYIAAHGLTYKRIGVIVFLICCLIGLFTVYIKVVKQKTLFYLVKTNGLVWYILLLAASFFNWDTLIVKYNIDNRDSITVNVNYLLQFSDQTLPVLTQNLPVLEKLNNSADPAADTELQRSLAAKILRFRQKQEDGSWLSWNFRDWQTAKQLSNISATNHLTAN